VSLDASASTETSASDIYRIRPPGQTIRYPLASKNICGTYQARGLRSYQEDTILAAALHLPPESLQLGLREPAFRAEGSASARGWEMKAGTAGEVACFGIFDGHGGREVSGWLRDELANVLENIGVEEIEDVVHWAQGLGGYFRRFQGGECQVIGLTGYIEAYRTLFLTQASSPDVFSPPAPSQST
jgi:protein phosphatase PTC6